MKNDYLSSSFKQMSSSSNFASRYEVLDFKCPCHVSETYNFKVNNAILEFTYIATFTKKSGARNVELFEAFIFFF